jgi:tripartite-type tricarboxylate transporter receptor subunit TctC
MNPFRLLAALALGALATVASGEYPDKPVKVIVPFAVGGTGDIVARLITTKIGEQTGKVFIVENRTGAGGRIGYEAAAKSPGDGYTLAATDATYTMLPGLYDTLGWNQATDLVPITISADAPFVVIVGPGTNVKTLSQLLERAKANPGKITFGSAGVGSVNHIATELFKREAKVDLLHVPYKGMGDAMTGLLTGTVDLIITAMPTAIPHIKSGKAIALAVTSAQRSPALPDVPTVREAGVPTYVAGNWFGLTAPKGTPAEAIAWVRAEVLKALASPEVKERLAAQGAQPSGISPEAFGNQLRDDTKRWTEVIRAAGIKAE